MHGLNDAVLGIETREQRSTNHAKGTEQRVIQVMGMYLRTPPIQRISWLWCMPMMTEPAPRNSRALKTRASSGWNTATE